MNHMAKRRRLCHRHFYGQPEAPALPFMTTLGAAVVFFFRKKVNIGIQRIFLGFAAGVMIAASIWSLLIPAIDQAEKAGGIGWIPAAGALSSAFFFWSGSIPFCPTCIPEQKTRRAFLLF